MATQITMPQLGESVVDGTVGEWLKQVGDEIEEFEPIVRVSTDKVDTEIPAPASGVLLAIHIQEGETVDSGVVLGLIGEADEDISGSGGTQSGTNGHHETATAEPLGMPVSTREANRAANQSQSIGHVTPVVMRMAEEHDLDLSRIKGTGRNGRIRKKDVLAYLEKLDEPSGQTELAPWEQPVEGDLFKPTVSYEDEDEDERPQPTKAASHSATTAPARPRLQKQTAAGQIPGELVTLSSMRRSIAQHMVQSKLQTAPHVTTVMEVDLSAVVAHRQAYKERFARQGTKLTFTPYFIAASASALQAVPPVNARWTDEGIYQYHVANIGIAVAIDEGLIVPVIKNAQDYNLNGLSRQVNDLADRARKRQLQPDEVRDGTFTITNHGVSGSIVATPIINQPQSAILGVGKIEKRVKVINDAIAIRPCAFLSLTFDHRVIDGATGDAFLARVVHALENWS